jgi:hypothetical protein
MHNHSLFILFVIFVYLIRIIAVSSSLSSGDALSSWVRCPSEKLVMFAQILKHFLLGAIPGSFIPGE